MADKPIIFSGPMVMALLDGRKTQTRRVLKPQPTIDANGKSWSWEGRNGPFVGATGTHIKGFPETAVRHSRINPGDRLWVREAHILLPPTAYRGSIGVGTIQQREHPTDRTMACVFREGFDRSGSPYWRPSIHMPRWASRLTLIVTAVCVQRLNDITRGDAMAEGCPFPNMQEGPDPRDWYAGRWDTLHGPGAWTANPWVAAYTFTVHHSNIDQMDSTHA